MTNLERPMKNLVSCRVDNPEACEELSLNKWGRGFSSYEHGGAKYYQNGMYQYKPENGLRVSQQRPFLTTEYYNSGCSSLYCTNNEPDYPSGHSCNGQISRGDAETNSMLDYYFQSTDPFIGNSIPVNAVGIKSTSVNSSAGWIAVSTKDGGTAPLWMVESQARGEMNACSDGNKYAQNPGYGF